MPITSDAVVLTALCAGGGAASVIDLAKRRIPNPLCLAIAAAGVILSASGASGVPLASSLGGFVLGFLMMLPGHILGKTGAGDVKLFAAAGTLLGAGRIVDAFLYMAIVGGVLALVIAMKRGRLLRTVAGTGRLIGRPMSAKAAIESPHEHNRFPYGPAVAAGCVLAVML